MGEGEMGNIIRFPKEKAVTSLSQRVQLLKQQIDTDRNQAKKESPKISEGIDPDIIKLARMKAEQIIARSSYDEHLSALKFVGQSVSEEELSAMIEELDRVILAPQGKYQEPWEADLARKFLNLTDDDSPEVA